MTLDRFTFEDEIVLARVSEQWSVTDDETATLYLGAGWRVELVGDGDPRK